MSTKIDGYKSLLTHITIAQNVQFHRDATGQIELLASQVSGIPDEKAVRWENCPRKANKSFYALCQITNGMLFMSLDDIAKSALEQVASLLNAQIYQK
jgi:hypothetical protein